MIFLRVLSRNIGISSSIRCTSVRSSSALPSTPSPSTTDPEKYTQMPGEIYDGKVKNEDLSEDPHQREVTDQFDHLYGRLKGYKPPLDRKPSLFSKLFLGAQVDEKRASRIPRGVYLWGTVGGGKIFRISSSITYLCIDYFSTFQERPCLWIYSTKQFTRSMKKTKRSKGAFIITTS